MEFGTAASRTNGQAMVVVQGEIDLYTAPRLWETIDAAIGETPRQLVIDLTKVNFVDSTGLSVLVRAHRKLRPVAGTVVIRGAGGQVYKTLELTKLTKVLTVEGSPR